MFRTAIALILLAGFTALPAHAQTRPLECTNWAAAHPAWIWCDDFESDSALDTNYFEVSRTNGRFGVSTTTAFAGTGALKGSFITGDASAGGLKLSIGRNPALYNGKGVQKDRDFTDVYWRFYMKTSANWTGNGQKVTRATVFTDSSWSQAAFGHIWEDSPSGTRLALDPATGVSGGTVVAHGYNDFAHMTWLGLRAGQVQVYVPANRDRWFCVEAHMKLNTPGQANGEFAFWIDDALQAETKTLNWRGSYTGYGINTVMLENYMSPVPQNQERYFDSFVVGTQRIGCAGAAPPATKPNPPTDVRAN